MSSGIATSSFPTGPLLGGTLNLRVLRKVLSSTVPCVIDQPPRVKSAAFFNESIIREIIRGRYLKPSVGHSDKRQAKETDTYTRTPLIIPREAVMWVIELKTRRRRLTCPEELGWLPRGTNSGCHQLRSGELRNGRTYPSKIQGHH